MPGTRARAHNLSSGSTALLLVATTKTGIDEGTM